MATSSATGDILTPLNDPNHPVLEDDELLRFLQPWLVALVELPETMVRPAKPQTEPANIPPSSVDWISFCIKESDPDTYGAELHVAGANSYNELRRHEEIRFLLTAYGPKARGYMQKLRDGMQIAQNREFLSLNAMGLKETGRIVQFPEFLKAQWYNRCDMEMIIKRQVIRKYGVETIASAHGVLNNEKYETQLSVEEE